jgi:hypothetical protein
MFSDAFRSGRNSRASYRSGADVKLRRRAMIIAVLVVAGAAAGWLTLNLGLDLLLGGRTFR